MRDAADELLSFWFGDWDEERPLGDPDPSMKRWWQGSDALDRELSERFGAAHLAAARGDLDGWADAADTAMARILLLDQIPRNIYRGTAHMFATDPLARAAARSLLGGPLADALPPIHRYFVLMPLMHSEDLDDHRVCVAGFEALREAMRGRPRAEAYTGAVGFAEQHRAIVRRFGRYPHRNRSLGRVSTPEELAFLEEPGSSF